MGQLKDATIAYATITKWLLGSTYQSLSHTPSGDWTIVAKTPKGELQYIVWTNKDKELFAVPKGSEGISVGGRPFWSARSDLVLNYRSDGNPQTSAQVSCCSSS